MCGMQTQFKFKAFCSVIPLLLLYSTFDFFFFLFFLNRNQACEFSSEPWFSENFNFHRGEEKKNLRGKFLKKRRKALDHIQVYFKIHHFRSQLFNKLLSRHAALNWHGVLKRFCTHWSNQCSIKSIHRWKWFNSHWKKNQNKHTLRCASGADVALLARLNELLLPVLAGQLDLSFRTI